MQLCYRTFCLDKNASGLLSKSMSNPFRYVPPVGSEFGKQLIQAMGLENQKVQSLFFSCEQNDVCKATVGIIITAEQDDKLTQLFKEYALVELEPPAPAPPTTEGIERKE